MRALVIMGLLVFSLPLWGSGFSTYLKDQFPGLPDVLAQSGFGYLDDLKESHQDLLFAVLATEALYAERFSPPTGNQRCHLTVSVLKELTHDPQDSFIFGANFTTDTEHKLFQMVEEGTPLKEVLTPADLTRLNFLLYSHLLTQISEQTEDGMPKSTKIKEFSERLKIYLDQLLEPLSPSSELAQELRERLTLAHTDKIVEVAKSTEDAFVHFALNLFGERVIYDPKKSVFRVLSEFAPSTERALTKIFNGEVLLRTILMSPHQNPQSPVDLRQCGIGSVFFRLLSGKAHLVGSTLSPENESWTVTAYSTIGKKTPQEERRKIITDPRKYLGKTDWHTSIMVQAHQHQPFPKAFDQESTSAPYKAPKEGLRIRHFDYSFVGSNPHLILKDFFEAQGLPEDQSQKAASLYSQDELLFADFILSYTQMSDARALNQAHRGDPATVEKFLKKSGYPRWNDQDFKELPDRITSQHLYLADPRDGLSHVYLVSLDRIRGHRRNYSEDQIQFRHRFVKNLITRFIHDAKAFNQIIDFNEKEGFILDHWGINLEVLFARATTEMKEILQAALNLTERSDWRPSLESADTISTWPLNELIPYEIYFAKRTHIRFRDKILEVKGPFSPFPKGENDDPNQFDIPLLVTEQGEIYLLEVPTILLPLTQNVGGEEAWTQTANTPLEYHKSSRDQVDLRRSEFRSQLPKVVNALLPKVKDQEERTQALTMINLAIAGEIAWGTPISRSSGPISKLREKLKVYRTHHDPVLEGLLLLLKLNDPHSINFQERHHFIDQLEDLLAQSENDPKMEETLTTMIFTLISHLLPSRIPESVLKKITSTLESFEGKRASNAGFLAALLSLRTWYMLEDHSEYHRSKYDEGFGWFFPIQARDSLKQTQFGETIFIYELETTAKLPPFLPEPTLSIHSKEFSEELKREMRFSSHDVRFPQQIPVSVGNETFLVSTEKEKKPKFYPEDRFWIELTILQTLLGVQIPQEILSPYLYLERDAAFMEHQKEVFDFVIGRN